VYRSLLAAILLLGCGGASLADVTLLGIGSHPGDAQDLSGLTGKSSDGAPRNRLGGHGSAIAYTGRGTEYLLVSDRGPKDGASDYDCRYHRMDVRVSPQAKEVVTLKLTATTLLTDEKGKNYVGALDAFHNARPEQNRRFDPEAVRVGSGGTLFVADEYGPVIYEFFSNGKRKRSLPVPSRFQAPKPGRSPEDELPPHNRVGRQPNRGMEGLAISPDGTKLFGIMQSPLIQDGGIDERNARVGLNCRILELEVSGGKSREFVYPLDDAANGVSEMLAVNDHEFLVLERDGKGGKDAVCKRIFHIDLADATDVSRIDSLPRDGLPNGVKAVHKKLFLDLLAKPYGIAGNHCPEKFEGLAFGPDLPDGRHLLLVTADNDFLPDRPFLIYAFAVSKTDLPNLQHQNFLPNR
jgi:hypothetical protein